MRLSSTIAVSICQALLVAAFAARAETLLLSDFAPHASASGAREVDCSYAPGGASTRDAPEVIGFTLSVKESAIDRLLAKFTPGPGAQPECPGLVTRSVGNPPKEGFDACVLKHMGGVTSDAAAYAIKASCIRSTEEDINIVNLAAIDSAKAGYWRSPFPGGGSGLYITMNNNSAYTLTELEVEVSTRSTKAIDVYVVQQFAEATPGAVIVGPPKDPTRELILPPGLHTFYVPIRETTSDPAKWGSAYTWGILNAKGFAN